MKQRSLNKWKSRKHHLINSTWYFQVQYILQSGADYRRYLKYGHNGHWEFQAPEYVHVCVRLFYDLNIFVILSLVMETDCCQVITQPHPPTHPFIYNMFSLAELLIFDTLGNLRETHTQSCSLLHLAVCLITGTFCICPLGAWIHVDKQIGIVILMRIISSSFIKYPLIVHSGHGLRTVLLPMQPLYLEYILFLLSVRKWGL